MGLSQGRRDVTRDGGKGVKNRERIYGSADFDELSGDKLAKVFDTLKDFSRCLMKSQLPYRQS